MSVASTAYYNYRGRMNHVVNTLSDEDEKLKNENPLIYYLKHINDKEIMKELRWKNRALYQKVHRIHYILSFKTKEPLRKCPDCGETITSDEWGEEYCPRCGLITRNSYNYTAGEMHELPYGLKIV